MKKTMDFTSKEPLHQQAESLLRKMIYSEKYSSGAILPNEIDLAKEFGISRNTLRYAITRLVMEGLLIRKKGVGTTVNKFGKASSMAKNWLSFSQEMKAMGVTIKNYELHICWEAAYGDVAAFFNIKEGTRVLKMSRVRGNMTAPIVFFFSYFNPAIGMTGDEDFNQPLYSILEEKYSIVVHKSIEEISAVLSDDFLADKLFINKGLPILKRKRLVLDPTGMPVEYNVGLYNSEYFTYKLESER